MDIGETVQVTTRAAWRAWLARHHATAREIWFIYNKKASGKPSVAYGDAVEEALCYGWIDSVLNSIDHTRYRQLFSPRKPTSEWSKLNKTRVAALEKAKLMMPAASVPICFLRLIARCALMALATSSRARCLSMRSRNQD